MQQGTMAVSLREVLRRAIAALPENVGVVCRHPESESFVAPFTRTSEDRSRVRQLVLEELARRAQARRESDATATDSKSSSQPSHESAEPSLFTESECSKSESLPTKDTGRSGTIPRIGKRSCVDVRDLVEACYRSLLRPLPEEHVILDSIANAEFIVRCRELGATVSETVLNRTLLNNRKAGRHSDVLRSPGCRLDSGTFGRIGHAVEIAASLVQREWYEMTNAIPSVDDMLCDPEQRRALRTYVSSLHADVNMVDCHLVLLGFRKAGRSVSGRAAGLQMPEQTLLAPLRSLDPRDLPETSGIYRVLCRRRPVFVSWTTALQSRMREHLERGGHAFLPESLPFEIDGPLSVEVFGFPAATPRVDLDALTRRLRLQTVGDQVPKPPDLNWRETETSFGSQEAVIRRAAMAC